MRVFLTDIIDARLLHKAEESLKTIKRLHLFLPVLQEHLQRDLGGGGGGAVGAQRQGLGLVESGDGGSPREE